MKITNNVISDLAPLYFANEVSEDTRKLIEAYFEANPQFAEEMKRHAATELPQDIPITLKPEDEMMILNKTKKLLKFRAILFGIALFFSLLPFAFGDVSWSEIEGVHWLWSSWPTGAVLAGLIGLAAWAGYFMIRTRLRTTAL